MELYQPQLQFGGKVYQPGVYDISNKEYHASAGISRSAISEFLISPLHYWDKYINPDKPEKKKTKSFDIGEAAHTYLIENNRFNEEYIIVPKFSGKGMKAKKDAFLAEHPGKISISQKDFDAVMAIVRAVEEHPTASILIKNAVYEKSIYWIDEPTGLLCKARPDIWHCNMIADLKTTKCANPYSFAYAISEYDYHIQAAMILDAIKTAALEEHNNYFLIAAETKRPHPVVSYPLNEQSIFQGRNEYRDALYQMKVYFKDYKDKKWPGYEDQEIGLPRNRIKN